jgi:predicted transcriptional regulator
MMKRNNDILRRILLDSDQSQSLVALSLGIFRDFPDVTESDLNEHIEFLVRIGFLEKKGDEYFSVTWNGHDFLGYSCDSVTWRSAKVVAGDLSFDCFYAILKDLMLWRARKIAEEFAKTQT